MSSIHSASTALTAWNVHYVLPKNEIARSSFGSQRYLGLAVISCCGSQRPHPKSFGQTNPWRRSVTHIVILYCISSSFLIYAEKDMNEECTRCLHSFTHRTTPAKGHFTLPECVYIVSVATVWWRSCSKNSAFVLFVGRCCCNCRYSSDGFHHFSLYLRMMFVCFFYWVSFPTERNRVTLLRVCSSITKVSTPVKLFIMSYISVFICCTFHNTQSISRVHDKIHTHIQPIIIYYSYKCWMRITLLDI